MSSFIQRSCLRVGSLLQANRSRLVPLASRSSQHRWSSGFAAVDHSSAYEKALEGSHGRQLALAALEGLGKDDPVFDPFLEEELAEARQNDPMGQEQDDYDAEEEGDTIDSRYFNDGSVRRAPSELAELRAGAPAGGITAVIELSGTQYKVTTDDVVICHKLKPVEQYAVGSIHTLDVLLLSTSHYTLVGLPKVEGATVQVMVEEITKDAKVTVFKKRRRKHSQRKNGYRREVTMLRILEINPPEAYEGKTYLVRPEPRLLEEDVI